MTDSISVLIVDDERPARQILRELVAPDDRFEIVAECAGGQEAIDAIRSSPPDLVLLDIQMPEVDGFDVLADLQESMPTVIMVTAFNEHAIRAFDFHALDYLLKPVDEDRLRVALERAAVRIRERQSGRLPDGLQQLLQSMRPGTAQSERIALKAPGSFLFIEPNELEWIEVAKNYLRLHCTDKMYVQRSTITELLERLDTGLFVRIHRSYAVNRAHVREIRPAPGGSDVVVVLRQGVELPVGRTFREEAMAKLM
jgi:two-component system LytT family response regulator